MAENLAVLKKFKKMVSQDVYLLVVKQLDSSDEAHKNRLIAVLDKLTKSKSSIDKRSLLIDLAEPIRQKASEFMKTLVTAQTKYSLNKESGIK